MRNSRLAGGRTAGGDANTKSSQRHTFIAAALITRALRERIRVRRAESEEALAKATQNPIASLISVPMQYNYDQNIGPQRTGTQELYQRPAGHSVLDQRGLEPDLAHDRSGRDASRTSWPASGTQSGLRRHHAKASSFAEEADGWRPDLGRRGRVFCCPLRPTICSAARSGASAQLRCF